MKIVKIILSKEAKEVYDYLNKMSLESKQERMILKAINYKFELIKNNFQYGDAVAKNLIPEEYSLKYGATNLFRVELPAFWRMIYTLNESNNQVDIIAFVLDIIDHPTYNNKFGYRKN